MNEEHCFDVAANWIAPKAGAASWLTSLWAITSLGLINAEFDILKSAQGGLAVGGRLSFDGKLLVFSPNEVNRAFNQGELDFQTPLKEIRGARSAKGFISGKLLIQTRDAVMQFRCFNTERLADIIRSGLSQKFGLG